MALTLGFPRRPYAEFYMKGDWHNLIHHVKQNPAIKLERARKNEQSKPTPSECTLYLNNDALHGNGDYSPRNPMGQWYPDFRRNMPFRYGLEFSSDDFNRTVASGWGSSADGADWGTVGTGVWSSSVDTDGARHSITSTNSYIISSIDDLRVRNIDVSVSVFIESVPAVLGGNLEPATIILRMQDTSHYYMCRMTILPSHEVLLLVLKYDGLGNESILIDPVTLPVPYAGDQWRVRAQMDGRSIRFKAWPSASAEPLEWPIDQAETGTPFGPGTVGVRSGVAAGNSNAKPVVFRYNDLVLRIPRYAGETSSVVPENDLSENIRVTRVESGTLFRRKIQGTAPIQSPMRRFISTEVPGLIGYWPAEDGKLSTQIASGIVGGSPMALSSQGSAISIPRPTIKFAADDTFAASAPLPHTEVSIWTAYLTDFVESDRYDVRFLLNMPNQSTTPVWGIEVLLRGTANRWQVISGPTAGTLSVFAFDKEGLVLSNSGVADIFDTPAYWYLQLVQTGSTDILYSLSYLPIGEDTAVSYLSGTLPGYTLGRLINIRQISGFAGLSVSPPSGLTTGHIYIGTEQIFSTEFAAPLSGFLGDTATERMARLVRENGLPPMAQSGESSPSALMGPQQVDTVLNLLLECAATDHGLFGDARGSNSFAYIPLVDLYNLTPYVVLDHDQFHLAPVFQPTDDDATTVNDVTMKARQGSSTQKIALEGPLNANDPGTVDGAVGQYDKVFPINPGTNDQLDQSAAWALHLGTVDEPRFPDIEVNLASPTLRNNTDLTLAILDLDVGEPLEVINLQNWDIFDPTQQLVLGYTEITDTAYSHTISFNAGPYSPYIVAALNNGETRLDSSDSSLVSDIDDTQTTFEVTTPHELTRWVTAADEITSGAATGQGTSLFANYLIATDSEAQGINIGDQGYLYSSLGVKKETTEFTVTGKNSSVGFTNIEFTPDATAVTVAGDIFRAHFAENFPFDIRIGGERMTVTGISSTGDPQTFTVIRSVNGVVKSHSANDVVRLFKPFWLPK